MSENIKNDNKENITRGIFLFGKISATLVIPSDVARDCGLDNEVVIEKKSGGIFIRKLADDY